MKTNRWLYCCVCLMILAVFGALAAAPVSPTTPDYEKNLHISIGYQNGEYNIISQEILYGTPPNLAILSGPIKGVITDGKGSGLGVFYISEPGISMGEIATGSAGNTLAPYTEHQSSGELDLNLPVFVDMQTVSLYDTSTGMLLVSTDINPAFTTFCVDNPKDPDCMARGTVPVNSAAVPDTGLLVGGLLAGAIIAAGLILFTTRRVKEPGGSSPSKQTVLLVDDSPDIIAVVAYTLAKGGYHCITASSGKECLDILKAQKPDVILLDVFMEPLDGWSTLKQIKKNPGTKSIPVLMLTSNRLTAQEAQQYHICIENYIRKPFRDEELFAAIEQVLTRKTALKESLAIARKAGVDREKFCRLASLSTRISVDKKIISILQKPDDEMPMAGVADPETKKVISDLIRNTRAKELQMEELKNEIGLAFTRKGVLPPSW